MAVTSISTQLRRKNASGDSDKIFQAATFDLVQVSHADTTKLGTVLAQKVPISNIQVPSGTANSNTKVPALDANSKLYAVHLPSWLLNGLPKPLGTMGSDKTVAQLVTIIQAYMTQHGITDPNTLAGSYFVADVNLGLSWTNGAYPATEYVVSPGDEGVTTSPIPLEKGDMVVLRNHILEDTEFDTPETWEFFIMNNAYGDATVANKGVVRLSNIDTLPASPDDDVITEAILKALVGTGAGKIAAGDHLHAATYLAIAANAVSASKWATARTITLGGDASGNVSLDGSANVTLTVTVADDSHAHAFANLTSKPSTIAGYGISNAYTKTEIDNVLANKPNIYGPVAEEPLGLVTGDYWLEIISLS